MIRRLLLSLSALTLLCSSGAMAAGISYPEAPGPNPDHLITPPGENQYFYMRPDGQAFRLQIDTTNNMADYLNRHYYDPSWRGETWSPWDVVTNTEKMSRSLATWTEYNSANRYRVWTGFNQLMERYSGFGP